MASDEKMDKEVSALEEIARWVRFLAWGNASEVLARVLKTDEDRAIYHLSDGRSTREIGSFLTIGHDKVARRWVEWYPLGIMKESKRYPGRREAVFRLEEFGVVIPERARERRDSGAGPEDTDRGESPPT